MMMMLIAIFQHGINIVIWTFEGGMVKPSDVFRAKQDYILSTRYACTDELIRSL